LDIEVEPSEIVLQPNGSIGARKVVNTEALGLGLHTAEQRVVVVLRNALKEVCIQRGMLAGLNGSTILRLSKACAGTQHEHGVLLAPRIRRMVSG